MVRLKRLPGYTEVTRKVSNITELQGQIHYWQSKLLKTWPFLSPSLQAIIRGTIKSLKELQKLKAGEK